MDHLLAGDRERLHQGGDATHRQAGEQRKQGGQDEKPDPSRSRDVDGLEVGRDRCHDLAPWGWVQVHAG
jgi:hypothetical protein